MSQATKLNQPRIYAHQVSVSRHHRQRLISAARFAAIKPQALPLELIANVVAQDQAQVSMLERVMLLSSGIIIGIVNGYFHFSGV